jgi:hypothetical protein
MRDEGREEKLTTSLVNMEGKPAGDHLEEGGADAVILDVHQDPDTEFYYPQVLLRSLRIWDVYPGYGIFFIPNSGYRIPDTNQQKREAGGN